MSTGMTETDLKSLRLALRLARRGDTSPNPMVGAVLVKSGRIIGRGWHRRAGLPHAEIEAISDARKRGHSTRGATLYVTLEPCCTHGRTPPCTDAVIIAAIRRVVVGTTDPNPKHAGKGLQILRRAGIEVQTLSEAQSRGKNEFLNAKIQSLGEQCARLNEAFNHWIVKRTPFVTVKCAMTLDGKIATASGESKWITGEAARACGMKLRQHHDAILVGVNTILADNPALTVRQIGSAPPPRPRQHERPKLRRIILDSMARTPLHAKVVSDEFASLTTIVVSSRAPKKRVAALAARVNILVSPVSKNAKRGTAPKPDLRWLLKTLGTENVTSLLVEGGGEVNASLLLGGFAQRVAFFYAPKIIGGRDARKAVGGDGVLRLADAVRLSDVAWQKVGSDLLLTARVETRQRQKARAQ